MKPLPYVNLQNLTGLIPSAFLLLALDDNKDGKIDRPAWNKVAQDVTTEINSLLASRYVTPFSNPLPALVVHAAKIFACEACYARRGTAADANPFTDRANALRKQLAEITGSLDVAAALPAPDTVAAVTAPSGLSKTQKRPA